MGNDEKFLETGKLKFRPKARLLYLLGHELITDEVIALVELVKNAYDADATKVEVSITDVTKEKNGMIEIRDNGHGMLLETIKVAWMEPARNNKTDGKGGRLKTKRFGRRPLGEKGVGRFSVDKLGLKVDLISRHCEFDDETKEAINLSDTEVVLTIEGSKFTEDSYLDEIECVWKTRKPTDFKNDEHGTILRISEFRRTWSTDLIEKVRMGLARLSSPGVEVKDFKLSFNSNEFPDLTAEIENPLIAIAPYSLKAEIDETGMMNYTIEGTKVEKLEGKKDLRIGCKHFRIDKGKKAEYREPTCGPFKMELYAFVLDRNLWKDFGWDKPKNDLLKSLYGVSIYRDGFRIFPYGEKGDDWLYFDKRRIQNPGKVLGNDRVIGYVEISQVTNPKLRDKTNREGLIEENVGFADLRELAIVAGDILGIFRHNTRPQKKRSKAKAEEGIEDIETGSSEVEESSTKVTCNLVTADKKIDEEDYQGAKVDLKDAKNETSRSERATVIIKEGAQKLLEELAKSEEQIENMISLSGIGMTAERMTHELSNSANNAKKLIMKTKKMVDTRKADISIVSKNLDIIHGQLEIIIDHIRQMGPLYYSQRRKTQNINIGKIAHDMVKFYIGTVKKLGIVVEIKEESKLRVDINRGHILQVFNNLFDNSFFWLENDPQHDPLRITIQVTSKKEKSIIFADNGPGIDNIVESSLFDPFVSRKPDGRGLGLYIVADILQNYHAEIETLAEKDKILPGANFKITFLEG